MRRDMVQGFKAFKSTLKAFKATIVGTGQRRVR